MIKFVVCQKYFDNGMVDVYIEQMEEINIPENYTDKYYDAYYDSFDTEEEAQDFMEEAMEA